MNPVLVIFLKELKDQLRDRRTVITMIVIPLLLFPIIFVIAGKFAISHKTKMQEKVLKIGFDLSGNRDDVVDHFRGLDRVEIMYDIDPENAHQMIEDGELDALYTLAADFDEKISTGGSGQVYLAYKSPERDDARLDRMRRYLRGYMEDVKQDRFRQAGLSADFDVPVSMPPENETNLASTREVLGNVIGGFLPYIFILFCFMGGMHPAIDLGAGEKERGTIETLLTAPVKKIEVLTGKFLVVVLTSLFAACISILGLYLGFSNMGDIPSKLLDIISSILQPGTLVLVISLLVPLAIFFGSVQLSISMMAKSFKEAQSMITPLNILVIVPAFLGMMPGMKLTAATAFIPVLNISLATKEIIAGTIDNGLLVLVYLSLVAYAIIGLWICARVYGRESNILV